MYWTVMVHQLDIIETILGGGGEIWTHDPLSRMPVFETGAFKHSATPPPKIVLNNHGAFNHSATSPLVFLI